MLLLSSEIIERFIKGESINVDDIIEDIVINTQNVRTTITAYS